jgi:hypothetical protein
VSNHIEHVVSRTGAAMCDTQRGIWDTRLHPNLRLKRSCHERADR